MFYDSSKCCEESYDIYERVVLGEGPPADGNETRGCNKNEQLHFLSGEVVGYCEACTRRFVHLADIEHHRYVHHYQLYVDKSEM